MEGPQVHSVYKHPKIAKNTSSKLPQGFLHAKTTIVVPKKMQKEKISQTKTQSIQQSQKNQNINPVVKNSKKQGSRNPFLPIHKFKEQMKKFQQERKAALQSLQSISMLSLNQSETSSKVKYEDCITLSVVNRTITTCLKKILHIPSLKVYYLRQSMINMAIQKSEVVQWMTNADDSKSQKICEMFWNMPQGYYSIIYQYEEGVLLESLLDSVNALPLIIIQNIALEHVKSNISIYNSQLLIDTQSKLHYLPIYEQTLPLISSPKLQEILQNEVEEDLQRKIMWRLGIVLLVSFLGDCIISSDLVTLKSSLKSCCLLHALIQMPKSLTKTYLQENNLFQEGQHLISFICRLMSTKKSPTYTKSISTLRKHKFLTYPYQQQVNLKDLTEVIDPFQNVKYMSAQQKQKMTKILDAISLILQNVENPNNLKIDFSKNNKNIEYIAKQVGMLTNLQLIRSSLESIYKK